MAAMAAMAGVNLTRVVPIFLCAALFAASAHDFFYNISCKFAPGADLL